MSNELAGKRIAFLVANAGVEQVELTSPWQAVKDAGGVPVLLAPEKEPVKTVNHDPEPGDSYPPDHAVGDASTASPTPTSCGWCRRRSLSSRGSPRPESRSRRS